MSSESKPSVRGVVRKILVAGDVCLDVVGVPMPPNAAIPGAENWQLTGETRTHFLTGGAMLMAEFIRAARISGLLGNVGKPNETAKNLAEEKYAAETQADVEVMGPRAYMPDAIAKDPAHLLDTREFLGIAERLRRVEIVHSLLGAGLFPTTGQPKEKDQTVRVSQEHGYSGPMNGEKPTLKIGYAPGSEQARILVLDDTGNQFRKHPAAANVDTPWPDAVKETDDRSSAKPLIVYKLSYPLPGRDGNPLWTAVATKHSDNRLIIVSVDDFRMAGAPISLGLSWERTALDVVWHLINDAGLVELRNCPRLIIRLDLDGAILWTSKQTAPNERAYQAWLIYDPAGIEGSFAQKIPGRMVGYGAAFTAAIAHRLAEMEESLFGALLIRNTNKPQESPEGPEVCLLDAIKGGLLATRRLLLRGFGSKTQIDNPNYPGSELFQPRAKDETDFACQAVPIIEDSLLPDRGGWRLLNQIFDRKTTELHQAVVQLARNEPPNDLLKLVPIGIFGNLRTHDRREIESYRSLHTLLRDYVRMVSPPRPLSFAVFGPPGAGKSFGVKEVAAMLKNQPGCRDVTELTFNLSLYQSPEELVGAFHLVRDVVLEGKVPLVFFDEFDASVGSEPLAWLRHFLVPMQDGKFLDREAPHPIGQAIFVFAGGTCDTFREFEKHPGIEDTKFKQLKGPDFLSRLRATLDIPSLNLIPASSPIPDPQHPDRQPIQPPNTYNPFGPIETLPCEAAVLLRRAAILSFNLAKKAPNIVHADKSLAIDPAVLRALLFMPLFAHGNRSFEALMDMSHLADTVCFTPSLLPAPFQIPLHADAKHFGQLVGTAFPFSNNDRLRIAEEIHKRYLEQRIAKKEYKRDRPSHQEWAKLAQKYVNSNAEQADDIPRKLLTMGLWLRKCPEPANNTLPKSAPLLPVSEQEIEVAARLEHDRWVASERSKGAIYGPADNSRRCTHPCIVSWDDSRLTDTEKDKDRDTIRDIPRFLAAGGYEVIRP